jgi:hypothetical protein
LAVLLTDTNSIAQLSVSSQPQMLEVVGGTVKIEVTGHKVALDEGSVDP